MLDADGTGDSGGRRGRGRRVVADGPANRGDDGQQAGDTSGVGHASIQGTIPLPPRIPFSICGRNAAGRSIGGVRVLIVEDEPLMAEAIRDGLRLEAIAADIAGDGDTALELLAVGSYDMPILMLTAADRLDDKESGFELGADDYLTKPFELRELVLRLRALDRRRASV